MKKTSLLSLISWVLLLVGLCSAQQHASDHKGSLITIDPPGSTDTRPFGINNKGQIVGLYITADKRTHGFLLSNGEYSTIDIAGSTRTNALAIDAHGRIVGRYDTPDGRAHGYLLSNGVLTTIDAPDSAGFTVVTDISPSGKKMVGRYLGTDGRLHGFSLIAGHFKTIDEPDGVAVQGMALNSEGVIAGYYMDAAGIFHGFLLDEGTYTTLDPPDSISTGGANGVLKINSEGEVVGFYSRVGDAAGASHAFQHNDDGFTTFDFPDATLTCNFGINSRGDIVGLYVDQMGVRHGFLALRGAEWQPRD